MDFLFVAVLGAVAIIVTTSLAQRIGVAAPLILVLLGVTVSFLPFVPPVVVTPEVVLAGVLPPLLYSTAVALPTMDFRRDLTAISGLSVILVVLTSLLLGLLFSALIPDLGFAGGVALGAIVSPTDAVATATVRRLGAPPRVVTVLEGEGLLNDASALVVLRSAVAATASVVSFGDVLGDFVWAVVGAVACGAVAGWLGLRARRRVSGAALSTAVSFVVPFVAYAPAEELHASGLVAVVTAGLVTGAGSARYLSPQDRVAERSNWRTVETLLEGGVFLLMGLELFGLVEDVQAADDSVAQAGAFAALAAVAVLVVRGAYLAPLLRSLARRARRGAAMRSAVERLRDRIDAAPSEPWVERFRRRIVRTISDIDYLTSKPLGPREGVLLVWAGMRGVVTLAAAQSLPVDFPHRSFLVLVAFGVAAGTLLVQGGTLPWVVRRLGLAGAGAGDTADFAALRETVDGVAARLLSDDGLARPGGGPYDATVVERVRADVVKDRSALDEATLPLTVRREQYRELRLRVIAAQRAALLEARASGAYDSGALERALDLLDAEQIVVEMRTGG